MSASGQEQTFRSAIGMSAFPPKADIEVRLVCPGSNFLIGQACPRELFTSAQEESQCCSIRHLAQTRDRRYHRAMRNEVAYQVGAVAGVDRSRHGWAANLAPFNLQH